VLRVPYLGQRESPWVLPCFGTWAHAHPVENAIIEDSADASPAA
jgi:hypothetical protein